MNGDLMELETFTVHFIFSVLDDLDILSLATNCSKSLGSRPNIVILASLVILAFITPEKGEFSQKFWLCLFV